MYAQSAPDLTGLARDSEWRHLLHMEKTWSGSYRSKARGEKFFLSSEGPRNPEAELRENVSAMFGVDPKIRQEIQCRFLARRDFLLRKGAPEWKSQVEICEFSKDWLQRLNSKKVSLIFASAYLNSAPSSFGHTFLKLQNPENQNGKELLDYGVNFAARTRDTQGALYALYGLFGYFPGTFGMMPYHQMIKDYTNLEGRDLWEFELNLTPEEVQRLLFHLLELDVAYFDYYFLDDNCSFKLLKALEVARPGLRLAEDDELFVIPVDTLKVVSPLIAKMNYRPSLATEWQQRRDALSSSQRESLVEVFRERSADSIRNLDSVSLSAAQYLLSLKEMEDRERFGPLNYQASRERARRGPVAEPFQVRQPMESPLESPDSSSVQLGGVSDRETSDFTAGLRMAFHDQLSRNVGVSPFSHLEVLGFEWRSGETSDFRLQRYRVLEILSTQGIDEIEKPLSWGLVLGGDSSPRNSTRMRSEALGKMGFSWDLLRDRSRISLLGSLGIKQGSENDLRPAAGADVRWWILWNPGVRSLAQFEALDLKGLQSQKFEISQSFDLSRQLELRLTWRSMTENEFQKNETTFLLWRNFLL